MDNKELTKNSTTETKEKKPWVTPVVKVMIPRTVDIITTSGFNDSDLAGYEKVSLPSGFFIEDDNN